MFSKLFAFSTMLGLLAALPRATAQATVAGEVEVVLGGPDGLIQYNPGSVVGGPYNLPS
jgi:hypothetical protein